MLRIMTIAVAGFALCSAAQAQSSGDWHGSGDQHSYGGDHRGTSSAGWHRPMHAGDRPRPADWNSDGAPSPPWMWRGYGSMWPRHYRACRSRYSSYDYRSDAYRSHGRRVRCTL